MPAKSVRFWIFNSLSGDVLEFGQGRPIYIFFYRFKYNLVLHIPGIIIQSLYIGIGLFIRGIFKFKSRNSLKNWLMIKISSFFNKIENLLLFLERNKN